MEKNLIVDLSPEKLIEDKEEFKRFLSAISALEEYSSNELKRIEKMEKDFGQLEQKYISKLSFNYKDRISRLKSCLSHNQNIFNNLIKRYKPPPSFYKEININFDEMKSSMFYEGKFFYDVISYIIRDWSIESKKEREENYNIIINEILKYFPLSSDNLINYKFLLPGSGLNRLGYELCKYGYDIEAIDFLFLNGIFSDYIFNYAKKDEFSLYAYIDSFCNCWSEESVFKKYSFPDINIDLKNNSNDKNQNIGKLKLFIGDFVKLYNNKKECFDCIITSYFIDTAQNIIQYVEIIYNLLKKGGIWINLGPLLYRWSKFYECISIELPYDKLKEVICNYGFEYINEEFKNCTYADIDDYMQVEMFKCIFFTVKKI